MSESLAQTTCRIHFDRPASARCPSCKRFYCSECITEHDGKLTCAACLNEARETKETKPKSRNGLAWFQPMPIIHFMIGLIAMWVIFYLIAQTLTGIPDQFHDGTIWEQ